MVSNRQKQIMCFLVIAVISLGFIVLTDHFFYHLLGGEHSSFAIVAKIRVPSLSILIITYLALRKFYFIEIQPNGQLVKRAIILSTVWITMTAYFVLIKKVWVPDLYSWSDVLSFMVTGLIAEEILFRGILFGLGVRLFRTGKLMGISLPVLLTSILFGLQHFSYHDFQITSASVTQVIYTTFMGVVFATIKETSGRLWVGTAFHMLNNSFTLIRNFI